MRCSKMRCSKMRCSKIRCSEMRYRKKTRSEIRHSSYDASHCTILTPPCYPRPAVVLAAILPCLSVSCV